MKEVNNDKQSYLIEDEITEESTVITKDNKKAKKKMSKFLKYSIIFNIISILLVGLGLLWQWNLELLAWTDALWLAFAIELLIGWGMFVFNKNIFSPFIHGLKTFGLMFVGKRPKEDYYSYTKKIEDNQIPKHLYLAALLSSGILLVIAIILTFIVL